MMPGPVTRLPHAGSSSAILVGVSDYERPSRLSTLPTVRNNLDDLADVLTDPTYGGFTADRCRTLLNPRTRDDIAQAVCQQAVDVTDTLLVYYAGHGLVRDGKLILAAGETDPAHAWHRGLRYEELRELLLDRSVVRAANRVVILDCCFAGRAHAALGHDLAGLADIAGVYVLTATSPTALAIAPDDKPHTAFTGALLRVLMNGLDAGTALLPLEDVFYAVKTALAGDRMPIPMHSDREDTRRLALVRNRAAVRTPPRRDAERPADPEPGTPETASPPTVRPAALDRWALGLATVCGVAGAAVMFAASPEPAVVAGTSGVVFAGVYAVRSALTRHQR